MYQVKRVEAQDLHTELKRFAFSRSPGLCSGEQTGYEEERSFYHRDPVPNSVLLSSRYGGRIEEEMCRSTFSFSAFETPRVRNKRLFSYTLSAEIFRTLPSLDATRRSLIPSGVMEHYANFEDRGVCALTETTKVELGTSDQELREIDVSHIYNLSYGGDTIHEATGEDILYGMAGAIAAIDPDESETHNSSLFVPETITHESLPPAENVIANLGFWAIVEPFGVSFDQGTDYRSAAAQMRSIMHALLTGKVY